MNRVTFILLVGFLSLVVLPVHAQKPSTAEDYYYRGFKRAEAGNLNGAIADYTRALKIDPSYADAYFGRGYLRDDKGDYDGALADFNKYLELKPLDAAGYYNRGYVRDNKGDYEGAIADYTKYLEAKPLDADAYCNRGIARDDLGDHAGAIVDYNRAIELNPSDPLTYYDRGLARKEVEELAGAVADLTRYVEMAPRDPDGYNALAWLWATTPNAAFRDGKKAVAYARKGARLSKWRDPSIVDTLAAAYAETGNFQQAIKWQTRALSSRKFPRDERAAGRRRLSLYRRGKAYREN